MAVALCVGAAAVVGVLLGAGVTLRDGAGVAVCVGAAVAGWLGFGFAARVAVGVPALAVDDALAGAPVAVGLGFAGFDAVGLGFAGFDVAGLGFADFEAVGVARGVAVGVGVGFGDGAALVGEGVGVVRTARDTFEGVVVDTPAAAEPVPATAIAPEAAITSGIADTIAVFAARPFRPDPPIRRGGVWLAKLH